MSGDSEDSEQIARRRLLKVAVYSAPAILSVVVVEKAQAQASCMPATCMPATCMPINCMPLACMPND